MRSEPPFLAIADLFARVSHRRDAIVHGHERWSFGRLETESARLAAWLSGEGVAPGDFVCFGLPNGPWFLALTLAIYRCGATPSPLSPKLPARELREILDLIGPAKFVTADDLPRMGQPIGVPDAAAALSPSWKACTSGGRTGRPKIIVDARPAGFPLGTSFIDLPANNTVLVPGPLYHNAPFSAAVFALWQGSTVVTMSRFDATDAMRFIQSESVAWALMVPTMLGQILAVPAPIRVCFDLSSWRQVVHTAAPMAPAQKRAWIETFGPDHIWEVYGATEGLVRCWIGGREWLDRPGSVGRPLGGARLRILDGEGEELPAGSVGEVFAMPPGGPGTTYRYIGAERRATGDGWESIGDAGWLDDEGYLYLTDRKDDLIITGGVNVWPAEVEAALLAHPRVRSCAVFGKPDPDLGATIHAVIETDAADMTVETLGAFLQTHLARTKHPRSIELRADLVRDDAGKFRKPRPEANR